jgi:hypothetical protein
MTILDPRTGENVIILAERRALKELAEQERRKFEQQREMAAREQSAFKHRDYGDETEDGTRDGV